MMRISNIFRRPNGGDDPEKKSRKPFQREEKILISKAQDAQGQKESPQVTVSSVVNKILSDQESENLYTEALALIRETQKTAKDDKSLDCARITQQVEKIVDQQVLSNNRLLWLAGLDDAGDESYLARHSLNVCIYSLELGLGLGYNRQELVNLGLCAFFYDLGMVKYLDIALAPRKLSPEEYSKIKNHCLEGLQILEKIAGLDKAVIQAAQQHHERLDGSGYPEGLRGVSVGMPARILSITDVYEAMTHKRAYRNKHLSLDAAREILNNKDKFEQKIIKILIDRIGIYPPGSAVRLSTKEIAQVRKLNYGIPLRPVVQIIYDVDGQKLKETKIVDLITQPTIYIKNEERL